MSATDEIAAIYSVDRGSDAALQLLVALADGIGGHGSTGMSLTIAAHGLTIAGELIGYQAWASAVTSELVAESGGMRPVVAQWLGVTPAEPFAGHEALTLDASISDQAFIHLDRARYSTGGMTWVPLEGGLWRIRLSEVSGWAPGRIGAATVGEE